MGYTTEQKQEIDRVLNLLKTKFNLSVHHWAADLDNGNKEQRHMFVVTNVEDVAHADEYAINSYFSQLLSNKEFKTILTITVV